jgi:hypothetical protein
MIDHLRAHQEVGHYVPEGVFVALCEDDAENFPKDDIKEM